MQWFGRWQRAVAAGLAGMSLAVAEPAAAPAAGDAIATAKRDYEAIKAAGAGAEQQKLALPRQELPQLDLKPAGEPVTLPMMTARKEEAERLKKERAGRSRTWLLDAMNEPAAATGADPPTQGGNPGLPPLRTEVRPGDFLANAADLSRESERTRQEDRADVAAQKVRTEVVNPLNAFMASWMTPRDLELLKPSSPASGNAGGTGSPVNADYGPLVMAASGTEGFSLRDLVPPETSPPTVADGLKTNPYLTDLPSFAIPLSTAQANWLPAAEPVRRVPEPPAASEPPPAAVPTPPATDLSKARDDEKYFKQLKRF